MGLNFRKQKQLGKHVRLNMSKSGVGVSLGGKFLRISNSSTDRKYLTARIPGTGISYTKKLK